MTVKTCPDCGAPVGDDMLPSTMGCWYWGQVRERQRVLGWSPEQIADWPKGGPDPPCQGYNYDVVQGELSRSRDRQTLLTILIVVVIVAVFVWLTR